MKAKCRPSSGHDGLAPADLLAVLGLVVLCFAFPWRISFAGQIMAGPDAFGYFYPLYEYAVSRLRTGHLPLWNPYLFLGTPGLANLQMGTLYPLHAIYFVFGVPDAVGSVLALHWAIAATGLYFFLRRVRALPPLACLSGASAFALGGFSGAHAEHLNQIETFAWVPWQLLVLNWTLAAGDQPHPSQQERLRAILPLALLDALQILAGHTQALAIAQGALLLYAAGTSLQECEQRLSMFARALWAQVAALLLALMVAGVQVVPALELARLSVRGAGLALRDALAFSLGPKQFLLAVLPHFAGESVPAEYVAYVGVVGLVCAFLGWQQRRDAGAAALCAAGWFLALGGYNPLYAWLCQVLPLLRLFRAPARWLALPSLGLSLLIAEGIAAGKPQWSLRRGSRLGPAAAAAGLALALLLAVSQPKPHVLTALAWAVAAVAATLASRVKNDTVRQQLLSFLLACELLLASRTLPYHADAIPNVYGMQRRTGQVLAATGAAERVLSKVNLQYDPGDLPDLMAALRHSLSARQREALLAAVKMTESLSRNLPASSKLYSPDGYDGGLLPTRAYLELAALLPLSRLPLDGRLGELLQGLPTPKQLALLGVRFLLRDRLADLWLGGAYYELSAPVHLAPDHPELAVALPSFPANHLGLVLSPDQECAMQRGTGQLLLVALVGEGTQQSWSVELGNPSPRACNGENCVLMEPVEGMASAYWALLPLASTAQYKELRARFDGQCGVSVLAATLVNSSCSAFAPVALRPEDLVPFHYGDLEVLQLTSGLPRAYFSPCYRVVPDRAAAIAVMAEPQWDPRQETVVIGQGAGRSCKISGRPLPVRIDQYEPEQVSLTVQSPVSGFAVLLDAAYPGWEAWLDGQRIPIQTANYFYRAVWVPAGLHKIRFAYRPLSFRLGLASSATGIAVLVGLAVRRRCERNKP